MNRLAARLASPRLLSAGLRAGIGVALCAALVLPVLTPLAVYAEDDAPACCCKGECHCRYCKMHHRGVPPDPGKSAFASPATQCPCCPDQLPRLLSLHYTLAAAGSLEADVEVHPTGLPQTQARQRMTSIRVRQKRGPPTLQQAI